MAKDGGGLSVDAQSSVGRRRIQRRWFHRQSCPRGRDLGVRPLSSGEAKEGANPGGADPIGSGGPRGGTSLGFQADEDILDGRDRAL